MDMPTYLANANGLVRTIAMVETREALAAIDEILDVEGVDGVFIGPSDLSVALSDGASLAPRGAVVMGELARVVERARAHGKFASMFCFDGADARAMIARGFQFCSVSTDQALLRSAARAELALARSV
jgi:4-hydroxy-2-oxoheptanedioate aldolase